MNRQNGNRLGGHRRVVMRNELGQALILADAAYDNLVALVTALDVYSRRPGFLATEDQRTHLRQNVINARDNLEALATELDGRLARDPTPTPG